MPLPPATLPDPAPARQTPRELVERRVELAGTVRHVPATPHADHLHADAHLHEMVLQDPALYAIVVESAGDAVWILDEEYRMTYVTPSIERLTGYPPAEWMALAPVQRVSPETLTLFTPLMEEQKRLEASGDRQSMLRVHEGQYLHKDCHAVWVEIATSPRRNEHGRFIGAVGVVRSIETRMQMQQELQRQEERYRQLFEHSTDALFVYDDSLRFREVNRVACARLGYTREELLSMGPADVDARFSPERFAGTRSELANSGLSLMESTHIRRDGSTFPVEISIRRLQLDGEPVYLSTVRDVSKRKAVEDELARRERILEVLSRSAASFVDPGNHQEAIASTVSALAEAMQMDHAFIFKNKPESVHPDAADFPAGTVASQIFEWSAPGVPPTPPEDLHLFRECSYQQTGHARWATEFAARRPIHGLISELPGTERWPFEKYGLRSVALQPVFAGPEWWGFFGVDTHRVHTFSTVELDALSTMAELTGQSIRAAALHDELARERDRAEAANRSKSQFLATMSHEIRTPMNVVLGMIELARDTAHGEAQREHFLNVAYTSGESLMTLLGDILDLSKIEAAKLVIEETVYDVRELVQGVAATFGPQVEAPGSIGKNLHFETVVDDDVPASVCGDPTRVRQILFNLLSNAFKFTDEGHIRLELMVSGGLAPRLVFSVTDTGVGVASDQLKAIFNPFEQADSSTTRRYGGTGLGLPICRRLAHLMDGEIGVESTPGRGSTFTVSVPLSTSSGCTLAEQDSRPATPKPLPQPTTPPKDATPTPSAGLHLLVAEDAQLNQFLLRTLLDELGHTATLVNNGEEAVAKAAHTRYDAIIMDVHMPLMDGVEATRRIHEQERAAGHPHTPVIALTAHAMHNDRERLLNEEGMDDYVSKPFTREDLRAALDRVCPATPRKPDDS